MTGRLRGRADDFAKDIASTTAVQAAGIVASIVNAAVVARVLGADGKGVLAVALLVPGLLNVTTNPGLGPSFAFHAAGRRVHPQQLRIQAGAAIAAQATITLSVGTLLVVTGAADAWFPGVGRHLLLVAALGAPLELGYQVLGGVMHGEGRIRALNRVAFVRQVAQVVLTVVVLLAGGGVLGAVGAWLGAVLLSLLLLRHSQHAPNGAAEDRLDLATTRALLSYGTRAYAGNLLQFFNYRLDQLILNVIAGPASVGIYTVAVRLAELVWQLPNAIAFALMPRSAARPATADHLAFAKRAFRWTMAVGFGSAVLLAAVGLPTIRIIFSSDFDSAYLPMLALLPGAVALGGAKVLTTDIAGQGYPGRNAVISLIALVVTVSLDLALIPHYGVTGAAVASSIAYGVTFLSALIVHTWMVRRHVPSAPGEAREVE